MSFSLLRSKARKAWLFARQNGWGNLFRLLKRRFSDGRGLFGKIPVLQDYEFTVRREIGSPIQRSDVASNTINWFIPAVGKGSGGHLNIFRFMKGLEAYGFENRIVIVGGVLPLSADTAKAEIDNWFFPLAANVYLGAESAPAAFFSMATSWQTAYFVRNFQSTLKRCYFVQDFEPWFYPAGTDSLLAEETYRFGFFSFTAGSWLAGKLSTEYGVNTCALGFSFDRDLYRPMARANDGIKRVFFYARPPTARRAFELGMLVLRQLCQRHPGVKVVLAGWDVENYEIPFPCEHAGLVELENLAQVYSRCDVALVLSCSNLSLLPLELMACGVPVVSNRAPYTEWLLFDGNSLLAEPTVDALADALETIINEPEIAKKIRETGFSFSAATDWMREARTMSYQLNMMSNKTCVPADCGDDCKAEGNT